MTIETRIKMLKTRKYLLEQRDPVRNANIINKINRQLRKLEA